METKYGTHTENYNLLKPDDKDFYDINHINSNMDIVDEELDKLNKKTIQLDETVADISGLIGNTTDTGGTTTKGTVMAKLNTAQTDLTSVKTLIGQTSHTGGTSTAGSMMAKLNKLLIDWTTTRAGYIDRLASFGTTGETGGSTTAGSMMAKLNKLLTDWTTTRAGYIDKLANFGTTGETGGSTTTGTMMAKLNKLLGDWTSTRAGYINTINTNTARLTSTRAGYIDKLSNFGATGDTGGSTSAGTMMAKLNAILQKVITEGVGIKNVQRGTFQELSTSQDSENAITVKLTTINPAKTFIILNGGLSAGYSGSSSAVRGYIGSVGTTNFVYKTGRAAMTISDGFISWQAVEFY